MALFSSRAPYIASMRGYHQPDTKRATHSRSSTESCTESFDNDSTEYIQPAVFVQNHYSAVVYYALLSARPTVPTCLHDLLYQHDFTTYCTNISALPTVPTCLHYLLYQHVCTT